MRCVRCKPGQERQPSMSYALEQLLNCQTHINLSATQGTNNSWRASFKQYLKGRLTLPGEPIRAKRPESQLMEPHMAGAASCEERGDEQHKAGGHDTGTQPEGSDKDGRNTSVTNRAGQATPRCQAATSIRQIRAAITSGCHARLRADSDCMRAGWHTHTRSYSFEYTVAEVAPALYYVMINSFPGVARCLLGRI